MKEKDAMFFAVEPPPIEGLSNVGGFEMYIQSRGRGTPQELESVVQKFLQAAGKRPELAGVMTTFSANVPQMRIELDREKALTLGVPISDVFDTLQSTFGALYVNDFNRSGRVYQVQLQSEPRFRAYPEDIRNVYVRAKSGELVPLTALASVREVKGPETLERFNVFTSAKILGGAAPGYSSGDALTAMEEVAAEVLPQGYAPAWTGTAYQEKMSGGASYGVYLLGRPPPPTPWPATWLRWPDFRLPADREQARSVFAEIWERAGSERVEVACGGGRGRTGTALACVAVIAGIPADEAVAFVREHYDRHAVETPWQRRYVERFTAG